MGTYFYVGRTAAGTEVYDIPFYGFSRIPRDKARGCTCCRMVYWRAGCSSRHRLTGRNPMPDSSASPIRGIVRGGPRKRRSPSLPEQLRPFWGKRVFHPEPSAWHSKKRQRTSNRQDPSPTTDQRSLGGPVMKTGQVQDPGDGAEPYLEIDCWTARQYHVPEEEPSRTTGTPTP